MAGENVVVVSFAEDSSAYEAFTNLKELDEQRQVSIKSAAIVQRGEDGRHRHQGLGRGQPADWDRHRRLDRAPGWHPRGPVRSAIGGATGLLIGSLYDIDDAEETESVLAEISSAIRPAAHTVVLAEVDEQSDDVLDQAMVRLGGSVLRRRVEDVEAEIAAAEDAQRAAKHEARKQLLDTRRTRAKDEIRRIVDALKARAHALRERIEGVVHRH